MKADPIAVVQAASYPIGRGVGLDAEAVLVALVTIAKLSHETLDRTVAELQRIWPQVEVETDARTQ